MRVGFGIDVHRFGGTPPMRLAGVEIDDERGLEATSDGDVPVHAVIDALLGAAALGDIGTHFPSDDERWHGSRSLDLLAATRVEVETRGYRVCNVDITIVAQSVRVGPYREQMRQAIAACLGVEIDAVSVKATTTDGLGFIGRDEGVGATAVALIEQRSAADVSRSHFARRRGRS